MNLERVIAVRTNETVYRGGDQCVKVFGDGFTKADALGEALNQARVEECGLHVPKVLEVSQVDGKWALVTEYVEGKTLERLIAEEPGRKEELLELPSDTTLGALIEFQAKHEGMVTCAGDRFFEHMKDKGLYTTDRKLIAERVEAAGLTGVFDMC